MSSLAVSGDEVTVRFRASAREVTRLGVLDPQAASLPALLAGHLVRSLTLTRGGRPCTLVGAPAPRRAPADEVRFEMRFACTPHRADHPPAPVRFTNNAFFPVASRHIHFARARAADGAFEERVLTAASRSATFAFTADGAVAAAEHTRWQVVTRYVSLGAQHILAGIDHIAFLIGLMLLCQRLRDVVFVVTGFTIGHSVTLSLAVLGIVVPNPPVVEALIAFTVMLVAVESLAGPRGLSTAAIGVGVATLAVLALLASAIGGALPASVWVGLMLLTGGYAWLGRDAQRARRMLPGLTAVFGLVHGFGFAGVLLELGLPPGRLALALFSFNLGVEIGQLLLVALVWGLTVVTGPILSGAAQLHTRTATATLLCTAGSYWFAMRAFG